MAHGYARQRAGACSPTTFVYLWAVAMPSPQGPSRPPPDRAAKLRDSKVKSRLPIPRTAVETSMNQLVSTASPSVVNAMAA
jgi:hypothetical protein